MRWMGCSKNCAPLRMKALISTELGKKFKKTGKLDNKMQNCDRKRKIAPHTDLIISLSVQGSPRNQRKVSAEIVADLRNAGINISKQNIIRRLSELA